MQRGHVRFGPGRAQGTRRTRQTGLRRLVGALAATFLLTSCSEDPVATPEPEPTAQISVQAPPRGACYNLDVAAGLEISSNAPRVSCSRRHTSVTVAVGRIRKTAAEGLPRIESARVQRQIARTCKERVDAHLGGSRETRRLSRTQAVWFSPPPEQILAGARWFRCDLVIAGTTSSFAPLPRETRGLLSSAAALQRVGTCGTAAPGTPKFRRVACSAKHSWRARASIDLPRGTRYLGRSAGRSADAVCRDIEARRAAGTRLRWSFEWPTQAQWDTGQRYGLCWTPV